MKLSRRNAIALVLAGLVSAGCARDLALVASNKDVYGDIKSTWYGPHRIRVVIGGEVYEGYTSERYASASALPPQQHVGLAKLRSEAGNELTCEYRQLLTDGEGICYGDGQSHRFRIAAPAE